MDYATLVTEVALRSGLPEIPARAEYLVTQAERDLEKVLRLRQMEAQATITADSTGHAPLPADYLAIRSDGQANWTVIGSNLIARPDQVVDLAYYRKLPPVVANGTNWLLDLEPEIYVCAVLVQAYAAALDERGTGVAAVLSERIGALKRADAIARFNGAKIDYSGLAR